MKAFFVSLLFAVSLFSQGKVYLVIGSDTAIWDGMSVSRYNNYYNLKLYTSPAENTYKVMDPEFRRNLVDSYGNPINLTWWMIGGSMMVPALNNNVPYPGSMALYVMKQHHGRAIEALGDELSLHYHTFFWSDYDNDGRFYWNQALSFNETRADFDASVAEFLLEENVFPVSFRSGWHYMDNDWQHRLDQLLPYTLHNDYPAKRFNLEEPIDNIFDWSLSPSEWVPFRPSPDDYRVPGDNKSFNVRSKFMGSVTQSMMNSIFEQAQNGKDQVACFWAHLPEADFLQNIEKMNTLAHEAARLYPGVKFEYCTAVEAMQKWRGSSGTTPPALNFYKQVSGSQVSFIVETDKPVFQSVPFVALKNINEEFFQAPMSLIAPNKWQSQPYNSGHIVKAAAAVTDSFGSLSTAHINLLPDNLFVDDNSPGFSPVFGSFTQAEVHSAWNSAYSLAAIPAADSASYGFSFTAPESRLYNLSLQFQSSGSPASAVGVSVLENSTPLFDTLFTSPLPPAEWIYISTLSLSSSASYSVRVTGYAPGTSSASLTADVLRVSPFVRSRSLKIGEAFILFPETAVNRPVVKFITLRNAGIQPLTVYSVTSAAGYVSAPEGIVVPPLGFVRIPLILLSRVTGSVTDTLIVVSNDEFHPEIRIPVSAQVSEYFELVDNLDLAYTEYGTWNTSSAQGYNGITRYANINQNPPAYASFEFHIQKDGRYTLMELLPVTVNAVKKAQYVIYLNSAPLDSFYADQNSGSGAWKKFRTYNIKAGSNLTVYVKDSGLDEGAVVLRTDALKFQYVDVINSVSEGSAFPSAFSLDQNYPNPFNGSTSIRFTLPASVSGNVVLTIYDILGTEIKTLINTPAAPGVYNVSFDASGIPSGMYIYTLSAPGCNISRKLILLK